MAESEDREDQTEEPSLRRLEQAIERGDVAKSVEVNTWFVLAGGTLALLTVAPDAGTAMVASLRSLLANAHRVPADAAGLRAFGNHVLVTTLGVMAVPLTIVALAALAGGLVQHRPLLVTEPLMPNFGRVSPMAGLKRVFGKEAFVQFLKGLIKLAVVSAAMLQVIWPERNRLESFIAMDVAAILPSATSELLKLMGAVLAIYTFLAGGDFAYQKWSWYQRQKMTKRQIKDEYKETEGNPEIKAKLKQLRTRAARKRMMAAVPKASVVIMNPTHFAVALHYEKGMTAPRCVAKGLDSLALRIRALAEEHKVPVVENPPLARTLYKAVELDQDIPVEHYKAVAEVIGFVMRLRRRPS